MSLASYIKNWLWCILSKKLITNYSKHIIIYANRCKFVAKSTFNGGGFCKQKYVRNLLHTAQSKLILGHWGHGGVVG